jgi:hypothetical protein
MKPASMPVPARESSGDLRSALDRLARASWVAALLFGCGAAAAALTEREQFLRSWLVGFLWISALPLGSLALGLLHALTGGSWGMAIRRLLEAATRTLPFLALLFLPLALGLHSLYEWSHEEVVAADPILSHKRGYLNAESFWVRAAAYFALWTALATAWNALAARADRNPSPSLGRRQRGLAAVGLGSYVLSATFAAVDWAMSIEPHWFSTIYGLMFVVGHGLSTLAFAILIAAYLARREPISRFLTADHFHDLGKLLFAFTLLWAYVAYSQYLIVWSANLAEETPWYLHRNRGGWQYIGGALIAGHFALPFLLLLSRKLKRNPRALARVALWMLGLRLIDCFWLVAPAFRPGHLSVSWIDVVVPLFLGSAWLAVYLRCLRGRPLVSLQDAHLEARLEGAAAHGGGH